MNTNSSNRLWIIGSMLLTIAIVAMGWMLGISPKLSEAGAADQQLAAAQSQNVVHETELATIKKQFEQLPELKSQLSTLRASIPADDALSSFLDELHALEQQNKVSLTDFKAGDGQPYTPVKSIVSTVSTTNPLVTPENFVAIGVGVTVTGDNANIMSFINGVQTGPRLFLVTTLKLDQPKAETATSKATPAAYEATITGLVYVLLDNPPAPPKAADTSKAPKG